MGDLPAPPLDPALFADETGDIVWVMHCADGPVPPAAFASLDDFRSRETKPWTFRWREDFLAIPGETRELGAAVLGVEASDLSLTATTSSGLVQVAQGYPWQDGDEVVVPRGEFPTNVWPWKALGSRGVGCREVALWDGHRAGDDAWTTAPPTALSPGSPDPETRLLEALGPRSRVLSVSWVRFQDGLVLDLPRLVRDGGDVPELSGAAAFVTGGHKGLLAPQGLGFLWTAPLFREKIAPTGSWLSVEEATDFSRPSTDFDRAWRDDGERLEQGVPNLVGCVLLRESLRILAEAGTARIAAHVAALRRELLAGLAGISSWADEAERLSGLDAAGRLGSIVALHHGGRGPDELEKILRRGFAQGVYASVREGYLRIALHGWHGGRDLDRLLTWLGEGG